MEESRIRELIIHREILVIDFMIKLIFLKFSK